MSGVGKSSLIKYLFKTKKYTDGRSLLYRKDLKGKFLRREISLDRKHQIEFEKRFSDLMEFFFTYYEVNNKVDWFNYLKRINWIENTAKAYMLSIKEVDKPVIIDESFIHRGLAFSDLDEGFLYGYLNNIPMPNYLMILEADNELIFERKLKREGARFKLLIKDKGKKWFYEHINLINKRIDLIEEFAIKQGVNTIRINTSNSLSELVLEVNKSIFKST